MRKQQEKRQVNLKNCAQKRSKIAKLYYEFYIIKKNKSIGNKKKLESHTSILIILL